MLPLMLLMLCCATADAKARKNAASMMRTLVSQLSLPRVLVPACPFLARGAPFRWRFWLAVPQHDMRRILSLPLGSTTAGSSECSHCMLVLAPQNSYASVSCSTAEIFISIRGNWWLREPPHHDRSGRCRHRQDPARDRTSHGTPMRH